MILAGHIRNGHQGFTLVGVRQALVLGKSSMPQPALSCIEMDNGRAAMAGNA